MSEVGLAPLNGAVVRYVGSAFVDVFTSGFNSGLMMNSTPSFTVHCEQRAGHWTSWVTTGHETKAAGSVVVVGQTQEEAEANARQWADRLAADPRLLRD